MVREIPPHSVHLNSFFPVGTKAQLVDDIRIVCPTVRTIVYGKWLMINGRLEEVDEGGACHQCHRVY